MIARWEDMLEQERVLWLNDKLLNRTFEIGEPLKLDLDFIHQCELALNPNQRATYVKYLSSDVSVMTYKGLSDEETQLPETTDKFYFNFLTLPAELRGHRMWNILADYAP